MIDEPGTKLIEDLYETHSGRAYSAVDNTNLPYTTGVQSKITGVNNAVDKVPAFTKEYEEEDSDIEKISNLMMLMNNMRMIMMI